MLRLLPGYSEQTFAAGRELFMTALFFMEQIWTVLWKDLILAILLLMSMIVMRMKYKEDGENTFNYFGEL